MESIPQKVRQSFQSNSLRTRTNFQSKYTNFCICFESMFQYIPIQSYSYLRVLRVKKKKQLLLNSRLKTYLFFQFHATKRSTVSTRRSSIIRSKPKTVFSAILNSRDYDAIARSYFQGRVGCQRSNREICVKTCSLPKRAIYRGNTLIEKFPPILL